ncbi:hypothetical protein GUJ93_ZPchr0006g43289 [Zizania palustris]|uniref:Uncharacterized protein n=1 Tax=Zizania palustris TaxID=103762 RepID=A0A8J5SG21_ZIZPA|nr:hypothetical protein GUJ93_ZPchr0006g43289 [Zizania palustris]
MGVAAVERRSGVAFSHGDRVVGSGGGLVSISCGGVRESRYWRRTGVAEVTRCVRQEGPERTMGEAWLGSARGTRDERVGIGLGVGTRYMGGLDRDWSV